MNKQSRRPFSNLLDSVFGSEASVRIVRELCAADAPLSRAEIARRSGLSLPGVGYALDKLRRSGVVEFVGSGARQSVQIRARHPLAAHLGMLFFVERGYGEAALEQLRRAVAGVNPAPRAAWIEESEGPAPAVLTVLAGARDVSVTREQLRAPLAEIESSLDLAVEARVVTDADVETASAETSAAWARATPLYGMGPAGAATARPHANGGRTHAARDSASLQRGVWIARHLERDPTLAKRARQWLVTRIPVVSPHEEHELQEWLDVLNGASVPRVQHLLSDAGERGTRLRQSNPFVPVLNDHERAQMRKDLSP